MFYLVFPITQSPKTDLAVLSVKTDDPDNTHCH